MICHGRWQVASIELSAPLPELEIDPGYDGLRGVFFWKGVPLGHCQLAAAQLPLPPQHLASIAAEAIAQAAGDYLVEEGFHSAMPGLPEPQVGEPLATLGSLLALKAAVSELARRVPVPTDAFRSTISVAICTRERPEELSRCLASLETLSQQPAEVLVIDNAPTSRRTREVVARFPGVRYHKEVRRGLSAARNTALDLASGDIVAFVDDDAVVHPDWLRHLQGCFEDPTVMIATGLVLPAELETPAQIIFEQSFQFFHQGYSRRHFDSEYFTTLRNKGVPVWDIGAGANMAIRRTAYEPGHRFDTRLGPGVFGGCGEDSEYWYGILASGGACVYQPAACVFHYYRRELAELRTLVHQYMQGHVAALILQFAKYGGFGNLRRLFLRLPAEYVILLLRLAVTGFSIEHRLLLRGALGCLSGLRFSLRLHRKAA